MVAPVEGTQVPGVCPQQTAKERTLAQLRQARSVHDWARVDVLLDELASLLGHAG